MSQKKAKKKRKEEKIKVNALEAQMHEQAKAAVAGSALVKLLIDKEIITEDEYNEVAKEFVEAYVSGMKLAMQVAQNNKYNKIHVPN